MLLGGKRSLNILSFSCFLCGGELRSCCECSSCFYTHLNQATKKHFFIWKSKCTMLKNINSPAFVLSVRASKSAGWQVRGVWSGGGRFFPGFPIPIVLPCKRARLGLQKGLFGMAKAVVWQNGFCLRQTICPNSQGTLCRLRRTVEAEFSFYFFIFFFLIHK